MMAAATMVFRAGAYATFPPALSIPSPPATTITEIHLLLLYNVSLFSNHSKSAYNNCARFLNGVANIFVKTFTYFLPLTPISLRIPALPRFHVTSGLTTHSITLISCTQSLSCSVTGAEGQGCASHRSSNFSISCQALGTCQLAVVSRKRDVKLKVGNQFT